MFWSISVTLFILFSLNWRIFPCNFPHYSTRLGALLFCTGPGLRFHAFFPQANCVGFFGMVFRSRQAALGKFSGIFYYQCDWQNFLGFVFPIIKHGNRNGICVQDSCYPSPPPRLYTLAFSRHDRFWISSCELGETENSEEPSFPLPPLPLQSCIFGVFFISPFPPSRAWYSGCPYVRLVATNAFELICKYQVLVLSFLAK